MWEAEPEVWDALIEAKPKASLWRNTSIPNYEKMMLLYGVDRANSDEGETMREWRKRHRSTREVTKTINDIDNLVSQGEFSLDNADMFAEVDGQGNSPGQGISPEGHSPHANSSCSKKPKRATKEHENNFKEMTGIMFAMVASLDRGNEVIMQVNSVLLRACNNKREVPQLSGEELCKMLQECGCDVQKIPKIFCFLMNDDEKLRTAVQSPPSIRKEVIMEMFYGSQ